jgi:hypothetical protein
VAKDPKQRQREEERKREEEQRKKRSPRVPEDDDEEEEEPEEEEPEEEPEEEEEEPTARSMGTGGSLGSVGNCIQIVPLVADKLMYFICTRSGRDVEGFVGEIDAAIQAAVEKGYKVICITMAKHSREIEVTEH